MSVELTIDRPGRGGDHIGFSERNFTAARLVDPMDNMDHQHNSFDTIEYMDFPFFAANTRLVAAVLANLADAPPAPGISGLQNVGDDSVKVSWEIADQADTKGYILALREAETVFFDTLITAGLIDNYTVARREKDLFASLSVIDIDENESLFSDEVAVVKKQED